MLLQGANLHLTINNKIIGHIQLKYTPGVRPTKSIVRQAVADMLRSWITDRTCIDLFAGSGAVGITILAEGAHNCIFVEENHHTIATLQANLSILQNNLTRSGYSPKQITTRHQSVENFLRRFTTDEQILVWADPPWDATHWRQVLPTQLQIGSGSYLAIASARHHHTPLNCRGWIVQKYKNYGNTTLEVLRKE